MPNSFKIILMLTFCMVFVASACRKNNLIFTKFRVILVFTKLHVLLRRICLSSSFFWSILVFLILISNALVWCRGRPALALKKLDDYGKYLGNIKSCLQKCKTISLVQYLNVAEEQAEDLIEESFSRQLYYDFLRSWQKLVLQSNKTFS